jgi:hypothetical protein
MNNAVPSALPTFTASGAEVPITINSLLQEIEEWRTKQGRTKGPIPDAFWNKIFILAKTHPPSRLRAILGISTTQYNKKLNQQGPIPLPSTPKPTLAEPAVTNGAEDSVPPLIEWKNLKGKPTYEPAKGLAINTVVVEFTRADGHVMKIHTTTQSFKELLQLFFEGAAPYVANLI